MTLFGDVNYGNVLLNKLFQRKPPGSNITSKSFDRRSSDGHRTLPNWLIRLPDHHVANTLFQFADVAWPCIVRPHLDGNPVDGFLCQSSRFFRKVGQDSASDEFCEKVQIVRTIGKLAFSELFESSP